jgi:hypothetical protein
VEQRERALRDIRNAWVAALVSAALTAAMVLLVVYLELPLLGFSLWSVISVVVLLAGAYGVSQRSRTAAVLLLIYFVVGQVSLRLQYPEVGYSSMFIVVIFAILYLRGAVAAFTYHRLDAEGLESDDTAATPVGVGGRGDHYG